MFKNGSAPKNKISGFILADLRRFSPLPNPISRIIFVGLNSTKSSKINFEFLEKSDFFIRYFAPT